MNSRSSARPVRRKLSRTLSRARWREYRATLLCAITNGYRVVSLEDWIREDQADPAPTLVLRHDVDEHPGSALRMAAIESDLGKTSTWYFRWRTADARVIERLRARGFAVGLHYETLSRRARELGVGPEDDLARLIDESRERLREEIAAFAERFGPIRSVSPHGDSRMPFIANALLMKGEDWGSYGVEFDGNEAMAGRRLACWLTDRSAAEGGWRDGLDPKQLLEREESPILCLTHPNNWASGASLWRDRVLKVALGPFDPLSASLTLGRPTRTRADTPPL